MARKSILYVSILVLLGMFSCKDTPCNSVFTSDFEVDYFRLSFFEPDSVAVDQPGIYFVSVTAVDEDSIFYADEVRTNLILPVDPAQDFTTYIIQSQDSSLIEDSVVVVTDTLIVQYNRRQRLISEDCGPEQLYVDFMIEETTYDSLNLFNDQLRTTNDRFIEIFY